MCLLQWRYKYRRALERPSPLQDVRLDFCCLLEKKYLMNLVRKRDLNHPSMVTFGTRQTIVVLSANDN